MKVDVNTVAHPSQNNAHNATRPAGCRTSQMTAGIVRHCQYSNNSATLASST
ncbi:Uncharacterised protein [Mycobacterium tuberculosis]|uniref:Uncharacterized protein n=1 Tax=Mycobacterium tuberculosis TaxID=1773 RepID=A0A655EVW5_MYCTX|nr:Uncharacterised protein [Mycobacterium tuberculosis]CKT14486.1 Uncharacterised protein [Mycobacterium tuberculosis]CNV34506.1 Uncharacterised protein [Mycobacterium tuberculosis]COY04175.1 Uncharacterised protein [Mycobacterium tuberculosis]